MARGKTLLKLLDDLRVEVGASLAPAHNLQKREMQVHRLQRAQEWFWDDFAWPHLRVERQIPLVVGCRYYTLPDDLTAERVETVEIFRDGLWVPLYPAIDGFDYAVWNSDLGQRSFPPRAWRIGEDGTLEVWPISDQAANATTLDGTLRLIGIRNLRRFVDDGDTADLDDRLVVMQAAAEMLQSAGDKAAPLKISLAQSRYARLKASLTKRASFRMFGHEPRYRAGRPFIANYRPPV